MAFWVRIFCELQNKFGDDMQKTISTDLTPANIARVLELLRETPEKLKALSKLLSVEKLRQPLGADERSLTEDLAHLINSEREHRKPSTSLCSWMNHSSRISILNEIGENCCDSIYSISPNCWRISNSAARYC